MSGCKIDGLGAGSTRQPDGRVRLLNWTRPDIDVAIVIMFALEGEWAGAGPGLYNQVVCLVHTFTANGWIDAVAEIFHARAAHKAGDNASATDHVEHSNLFGHPKWVIMQRQCIANNPDFCPLYPLRQDSSHNIWRRHSPVSILMMLVDDDTIPPQFIGSFDLIKISVI